MHHFLLTDPGLPALFVNDLLDGPPGSFQFELPKFSCFGLFEYRVNEVAAPRYPLVSLILLSRPASGYDLGPAAEASQEAAAGQFQKSVRATPYKKSR